MASVTRTIEPGISMFSASEMRVAFVPIGPVPRDKYEAYLDAFNKQRHVPLHSIRALHQETHKSPFSHIPWRTGALHLRFLADDEARRRTRIAELHAQRAVLAVVGVVHCPLVEDLATAHAEFLRAARQFPDALVARCCAFDPAEHHLQAAAALRDVMLFPAGTPAQLEAHVAAYAPELGAALLAATEHWVLTASVAGVKLNTHVDSAEFTGPLSIQDGLQKLNTNEDELREKKRWGRLQKTKGDVALISGAPRDAYEHYKSGMELSKIAGDTVWTAAALEGLAHARVMEALSRGDGTGGAFKRSLALAPGAAATAAAAATGAAPPGSPPPPASPRTAASPEPGDRSASSSPTKGAGAGAGSDGGSWPLVNAAMWSALRSAGLEGEVRELLAEAQGWYRRKGGALALQIECALKLARLLAGLRGKAARSEGLDLLGGALELVPQLPLLEDRLVALVEAAQVMGLLGCGRKRQLLLWAAVDLSRAVDRSDTLALRIATRALEPPDDPEAQDPDDLPRRHWVQRRSPLPMFDPTRGGAGGSWEAIRLATAEAALSAARSANSPIEAWEAAALIVREHGARLPQTYQATLLDALAQAASRFPQRALQRHGSGPGPLVQLRRIVPPPPALAPLRVSGPLTSAASRRGDGGGHGPFIFNPYAQKRQQGAAAAAAEGAVVEWVAGDEARVEVVLANPLAVPLRIDGISVAVQDAEGGDASSSGPRVSAGAVASPSKQQQAAVAASPGRQGGSGGGGDDGGGTSGGGPAAAAAVGSAVTATSVSVTLPHGGKPVKVILALTPHRPGDLLLRGVLVTAWGVTWEQPLTLLPRLGPLVTPGALRPQPPQRVRVLPRLPLLRASLAGPDVRVVTPQEGLGGGGSSRGGTGGGAGGPGSAPSPTGGGPASPSSGGLGKPASVPVFEGQHLLWTLTLANVSDQTIGACAVAALNAKGAPARAPAAPGGQLPASFLGVHLDTSPAEEQLRGGMPLEPRQSVSLPLSLVVGRPPADPFEEVTLELRITYTPAASAGADPTAAAAEGPSSPETVGRRVSLPLRFAIQPSLGITAVRFLQMGVPLRDGGRYAPLGVNLRDAALTRDAALYRCVTTARGATAGGAAGGGGLVRNNSEGALPSPSAAAALARQQQFAAQVQQHRDLRASGGGLHAQHKHQPQPQPGLDPQQQLWVEVEEQTRDVSGSTPRGAGPRVTVPGTGAGPPSPTRRGAAGSAPPAVAAPPASDLGLSSDAVLELAVVNRSDRYFRTWLARLPDGPGAEGAESAVVVLEPGDDARLLAPLLPDASAGSGGGGGGGGGGGSGGPGRPVPAGAHEPPSRIACAERLVESLGVRWEMITGDVAPDRLPRGLVRLAPVDIAHSVTPAAVASLAPSELHARVVALPAPGAAAPIELADVTVAARGLGVRLASVVGPVWAVRTAVGRPLVVEVRLTNSGAQEEAVRVAVTASDLAAGGDPPDGGAGAPGAPRLSLEGSSPPPAGAGAADGADGGLLLTGRCERVALVVPAGGGAAVHRLSMLPLRPGLYQVAVTDARSSDGSKLYLTQDRLRLLVQRPTD